MLFFTAFITGLFIFQKNNLIYRSINFWFYLTGMLILISGVVALFGKDAREKGAVIIGALLGIIYIIFNLYGINNYY